MYMLHVFIHLFLIFQPLSVGTLVLLRNSHQDGRKRGKLTKPWNGTIYNSRITWKGSVQDIQSINPKSGEKGCQHLQAETLLFW